jgi:serine/threonine-protein kinase
MTLESGTRLGHYTIAEILGAGGMGEVYRAHDTRLGRDVAIKVLPLGEGADEEARRRLISEARTASQLNHPHICTIYEVGEAEGLAYIAMERVEGRPLSLLIGSRGLPAETVVRYGAQLADAISYAHERGVIHRDLKCANVVVTEDGRIKVLDFGVAKIVAISDEGGATPFTQTMTADSIVGTLLYLAPEILRGGAANPRSDLWSLGVMLYEMASGTRPFRGATEMELCAAILNDPPESLPPRVPSGLAAIVERCLAKDPSQRYRKAGEIRAALETLSSGASSRVSRPLVASARVWFWAIPAGLLLLAGLVLLDVAGMRGRLLGGAGKGRIRSIAVLPLANFSRDPDQEYFADSMTEELIATLAQIGELRVISRTSVMGFKGTKKSLPEIGRLLGVDGIVEGSVHRSDDRVRITAQLIRAARDEHLWAKTYERDMRDVLALQHEVAGAIANEVQVHLTPRQRQKIASATAVSPKAYDLYLRAIKAFQRWDKTGRRAALELLRQALEIDSTYAPAWAARGLVYVQEPEAAGTRDVGIARARQSLDRALALDPDLGLAHTVKGNLEQEVDWDWLGAEREYRRAIELAPNLFEAHHSYSHLLMNMGRIDESQEHSQIAVSLDPLNVAAKLHMGWHYLYAGQIDRAIPEYLATLRLDPSYAAAYTQLAWAYTLSGRYGEAYTAHRKSVDLTGSSDTLGMSAVIAAKRGSTREALAMLAKMIEGANRGETEPYEVATVFAQLGRKDEAFHWLDRAIARRGDYPTELKQDPFLVMLHSDPRFPGLLRRVGLPVGTPKPSL